MALRSAACVLTLFACATGVNQGVSFVQQSKAVPAARARIAFVPLDDRPSSLQYPRLLAAIGDAELVTPPPAALGRHLRTGDGDAIARWLDALDVASVDAVVVSADMLAYGGLVGSREPRVLEADARRRLQSLAGLKQRRADLPLYAFSTVMRLAPTADGRNEGWRRKLARWAEISPGAASDAGLAAEISALERGLPAGMIDRYRQARARNRAIGLALVDMLEADALDFLAVAHDEPAASGVHVADRDAIEAAIAARGLLSRAALGAGCAEAGMLLVARAFAARFEAAPQVALTYSSPALRDATTAFERRALSQTVSGHLAALGASSTAREAGSALSLFVYASRGDSPDQAGPFARRIAEAVAAGRRVAVVDVDTQADGRGASLPFTAALRNARVLPRLASYASWGTAGSAVGSALSQGVVYAVALDGVAARDRDAARRVGTAQVTFLLHRLINDFLYEGVVRPQALEEMLQPRGFSPGRLDESALARVEKYLNDEVQPLADSLVADFTAPWQVPGARTERLFTVRDLGGFRLSLPWARMAEAEIDFTLVTD